MVRPSILDAPVDIKPLRASFRIAWVLSNWY